MVPRGLRLAFRTGREAVGVDLMGLRAATLLLGRRGRVGFLAGFLAAGFLADAEGLVALAAATSSGRTWMTSAGAAGGAAFEASSWMWRRRQALPSAIPRAWLPWTDRHSVTEGSRRRASFL